MFSLGVPLFLYCLQLIDDQFIVRNRLNGRPDVRHDQRFPQWLGRHFQEFIRYHTSGHRFHDRADRFRMCTGALSIIGRFRGSTTIFFLPRLESYCAWANIHLRWIPGIEIVAYHSPSVQQAHVVFCWPESSVLPLHHSFQRFRRFRRLDF